MKRIISILILITIVVCTSAAQPAPVHKAFEAKFPKANHVNWSNENATLWQSDFQVDGNKYSSVFTPQGTWIETIRIIKISELPVEVRNSIFTKFPHWEITELNKTENAKSGISYEVNLKKGRERKNIAFRGDGSIIQ
jgi:hypothetical protein